MQQSQNIQQSDYELSEQEKLTKARLKKISTTVQFVPEELLVQRPTDSLVELMNWTQKIINHHEKNQIGNKPTSAWKKIINNKISIDGVFLQYSEKNDIQISCVLNDAVTTWNSDYNNEQFLSSGIFRVSKDNFYFYVCCPFVKTTNHEDECVFFVILEEKYFSKYVKFRNDFSEFEIERDQNCTEIFAVGGDQPIPYSTNLSWDDVFLPKKIKQDLSASIRGFLDSKELYDNLGVPWKRGVILAGPPGTGKTLSLRTIMSVFPELKPVTIQLGQTNPNELLIGAFDYAEYHFPALIYLEDLPELIRSGAVDLGLFLQLLDGIKSNSGMLIIATGNDFSDIQSNLKSRPSRFDRFFEFPLPNKFLAKKYLKKYFQDILDDTTLIDIVEKSIKAKLSYSHLQEIYFNAVFMAIGAGREKPNVKDAKEAVITVIKEKDQAEEIYKTKSILDINAGD